MLDERVYASAYGYPTKPHDMEHDLLGYTDAMCNSQKPQPNDPDKKKGNDIAEETDEGY